MKIYPVKIEAVDELNELVFTVETFDEHCATIDIKKNLQTEDSLDDLFSGIREAFKMLQLETPK